MNIFSQTQYGKERWEGSTSCIRSYNYGFCRMHLCAQTTWACMWWSEDSLRCWSLAPSIYCLQKSLPLAWNFKGATWLARIMGIVMITEESSASLLCKHCSPTISVNKYTYEPVTGQRREQVGLLFPVWASQVDWGSQVKRREKKEVVMGMKSSPWGQSYSRSQGKTEIADKRSRGWEVARLA